MQIRDKLNNGGFSFIELLMVVLLTSILTTISVVGYGKYVGQARRTTNDYNARLIVDTINWSLIDKEGTYDSIVKIFRTDTIQDADYIDIDLYFKNTQDSKPYIIVDTVTGYENFSTIVKYYDIEDDDSRTLLSTFYDTIPNENMSSFLLNNIDTIFKTTDVKNSLTYDSTITENSRTYKFMTLRIYKDGYICSMN